jgi:hypothetical protein
LAILVVLVFAILRLAILAFAKMSAEEVLLDVSLPFKGVLETVPV